MNISEIHIGQVVYYIKNDYIASFEVRGIIDGHCDWKICSVATESQTTYTKLKDCFCDESSAMLGLIEKFNKDINELIQKKIEIDENVKKLQNNINQLFKEIKKDR